MLCDRYRIDACIGHGAFGSTYRASDLEAHGAQRAVKRLHPGVKDPERALELFEREGRSLAWIVHACVPRLYHQFREGGDAYLVEDFVDGEPWHLRLSRCGPIQEAEVCALAADVLDALDTVHTKGPTVVIHRDIKPSNLIRRHSDGRTVLIDFGAVREVFEYRDPSTAVGTPGYAPAEQHAGHPVPSSDLHALGATMAYLLTGIPPLGWYDLETGRVIVAGRLKASPAVVALIERLFCERATRIPTAAEALRRLREAMAVAPVMPVPPTEHVRRDPITGNRGVVMPAASRWTRPPALVGGFALLVASAYGAVIALSPSAQPSVPPSAAAGTWARAEATSASGLPLAMTHPAAWHARQPVGSGNTVSQGGIRLRVYEGSLVLELPDTGGVFVIGLDAFADPRLPIDRFLQEWARAAGGAVAPGAARAVGNAYQAALYRGNAATAEPVGFIHAVIAREDRGSRVLWRAFVGDAAAHRQDVRIVLDSLRVGS